MALGSLDKERKALHPHHCGELFPPSAGILLSLQYWVSFFFLASGILCMVWFYHILVVGYGTYSPFFDSNCMFPFSSICILECH